MFQIKKTLMGIAALAAFALGGAAVAGATSSNTAGESGSAPAGPAGFPRARDPGARDAEKPVTGAAAAEAQSAAVERVGGGTAGPVVNDIAGTGFETMVTKTDGRKVEVHLDGAYQPFHGGGGGDGGPGAGY